MSQSLEELPNQATDNYEARIRYLEETVRLMLTKCDQTHPPFSSATTSRAGSTAKWPWKSPSNRQYAQRKPAHVSTAAVSFRYSIDRGLEPLVSTELAALLATGWHQDQLRRRSPPYTLSRPSVLPLPPTTPRTPISLDWPVYAAPDTMQAAPLAPPSLIATRTKLPPSSPPASSPTPQATVVPLVHQPAPPSISLPLPSECSIPSGNATPSHPSLATRSPSPPLLLNKTAALVEKAHSIPASPQPIASVVPAPPVSQAPSPLAPRESTCSASPPPMISTVCSLPNSILSPPGCDPINLPIQQLPPTPSPLLERPTAILTSGNTVETETAEIGSISSVSDNFAPAYSSATIAYYKDIDEYLKLLDKCEADELIDDEPATTASTSKKKNKKKKKK